VIEVVGDKPEVQMLNVVLLHFCVEEERNVYLVGQTAASGLSYIRST
jgi:hypothetical protein